MATKPNKYRRFLYKRTPAEWLDAIKRISRNNHLMFQKLVRIVWWDIASYVDAPELKEAIDINNFNPDEISETKVAEKLIQLGYPEDFARKRSHFSPTGSHKKASILEKSSQAGCVC